MTSSRRERLFIYSTRLGLEAKTVGVARKGRTEPGPVGRALLVRAWGDTRWTWCYGWRDWIAAVRLLLGRQRGGTP